MLSYKDLYNETLNKTHADVQRVDSAKPLLNWNVSCPVSQAAWKADAIPSQGYRACYEIDHFPLALEWKAFSVMHLWKRCLKAQVRRTLNSLPRAVES